MNFKLLKEHYEKEKFYAQAIKATTKNSSERKSLLKNAYDEIIPLITSYNPGGAFSGHSDFVFKMIKPLLKKDDKILDFGCGDGGLVYALNKDGYNAFGFDISHGSVALAKKRLEEIGFSEKISQGEIWNVKEKYDFIVLDNVIEHIMPDEVDDVLSYCRDLLNQGGQICLITPHKLSGPHDVSQHFLPLGSKAEGFHFQEYSLNELNSLLKINKYKFIKGYCFHPRLLRMLGLMIKPNNICLRKSLFLENFFMIKPVNLFFKINANSSRFLTAIFFPTIIIANK